MRQSRASKFADSYKGADKRTDKRALRSLRRSIDWKQSRSKVVGKRRNMDAVESNSTVMSPVKESQAETTMATSSRKPASELSKAGKQQFHCSQD